MKFMLFYKIFFYLLILFNGFYYDTKSIDDILLSVGGDKLSQREWDYIKLLKPMKPDLQVVALGLLERRGDGNAIKRFNASETKI